VAAPTERVFVAQPFPTAGARVIASPFQFWSTGEDNLRVLSVNALSGVGLTIQGRFIDAAGVIGAARWDHTPASDRTIRSSEFPLGVGAVTPQIGQTFVIVQLIRGAGAAALVLGTLLQGYVTSTQTLAWPGSPLQLSVDGGGTIRTITGTTPAAGQEVREVVPTGARWQLMTVHAQFTASATVATRRPRLAWNTGGTQSGISANVTNVTATQQGVFDWVCGMPLSAAVFPGDNVAGLPNELYLLAGDSFATATVGLQGIDPPVDQWSAPRFTVREWLEVA
jgi:hypothetical protein